MKKVVLCMSIMIMTSIVFLGGSKSFNIYDVLVRENYEVVEQGIKLQYSEKNMDMSYLKNVLNLTDDFEMYNKNFYYLKENNKYSIEIKGIDRFIEIEIKDFNNDMKIEEIEKITKKMLNNKKDLKVFTYVKGKTNDIHSLKETSKFIKTELQSEGNESLKLSNGETGIIELNNEEYNYSLISYEKDNNYIIVGSPVIFITY
ncbi:hypothetical protein [uncultured Clostridium sp.]|uniref:hypothetical protein n=1 Tax=uncultured Clostridium sp. TaxID=59620 RepID=UPI0026123F37|nr:hypothetical protein [uncultured Clostridium sp.]